MYSGYIARFVGLDPDKSFGQLVPANAVPLFSHHYREFTSCTGYAPIQASSLSMPSFLFNSHTRCTLLAGLTELRAGSERPTALRVPAAVLAVQYLNKGMAPGGKFGYDQRAATRYGADHCIELNPKSDLNQLMYDLFWA